MKNSKKVTVSKKLTYGLGAIAYAVPYQIMATFFLFYATAVLHISPMTAGIIIAISVLWDAVTDPIIGHKSDTTQSNRFGRRHLYFIVGGVGTAIGSYLLWSIPNDASEFYKVTMVLILILFTKTTLTFFGAPYFAIGATMSTDYDERSSIQGYRATFHLVGMMIAVVGATFVFFKSTDAYPKGQLNPEAYPAMGLAVAIITLVVSLVFTKMTPKDMNVVNNGNNQKFKILDQAIKALKNTNFKSIFIMILLIEIGFQISISTGFHVNTYVYNLSGPQIGLLIMTLFGCSILSQPLWLIVSKKYEKKIALYMGMVLALIGFIGIALTFIYWEIFELNQSSTLWIMIGFNMLGGIGNGAFMTLPFSMVADSVDQNELSHGQRQEGLFFGLYNFAYKAGISISILISGLMLDLIGFDSSLKEQAKTTIYNLAMVPTWLLIGSIIPIVISLYGYNINRKKQQATLVELKQVSNQEL